MSAIWTATDERIAAAAMLLREGGVVGMPTETVYGLAADAGNARAVARVFETKRRPAFNPLIVHVLGVEDASRVAVLDERARELADAFWPGPLTMVLPLAEGAEVASIALAGLRTVAVRAPRHPVARALLAAAGRPLVAPSANLSGSVSPTRAAHVADDLPGVRVLDGGPCKAGLESTIVGLAGARPTLLRPGVVTTDAIEAVLGEALASPAGTIEAPGMMTSHYAPTAPLRLGAVRARPGEALLGFGGTPGAALDLSPSGDLAEAAANLFDMLRRLDDQAVAIAVAPVPERGLGAAINDRLRRAAAPR